MTCFNLRICSHYTPTSCQPATLFSLVPSGSLFRLKARLTATPLPSPQDRSLCDPVHSSCIWVLTVTAYVTVLGTTNIVRQITAVKVLSLLWHELTKEEPSFVSPFAATTIFVLFIT